MRKKMIIFIITLSTTALSIIALIYGIKEGKLIFNTTSSFPLGLYKISKKESYQKGDLVSFCAIPNQTIKKMIEQDYTQPNPNCPNQTPQLLKKILALEEDNITIDREVFVNGYLVKNSQVFKKDRNGNLLTIQPSQSIQKGYFWAMSDYNKKSYDSRYFGQVPLKNIIGIATPILTWD
jgi:conjugative transfer signal peptidase TraF